MGQPMRELPAGEGGSIIKKKWISSDKCKNICAFFALKYKDLLQMGQARVQLG